MLDTASAPLVHSPAMSLPIELPLAARHVTGNRKARLPRMAEIVAGSLRDRILSGELSIVPRLEDLVAEFEVGPPSVREAMRILETEGLITMRRGNLGGAHVRLPTPDRVAYTVSLVLQSRSTELGDVGAALRHVEPTCAVMCAARPDRGETIVPVLRAIVEEQAEAIGDRAATLRIVDRFHRAIVLGCGNETIVVVVGALERVWAGHAKEVYNDEVAEPAMSVFKASLREHQRIVAAIERGDPGVANLALKHLEATHAYMSAVDEHRMVTAAATADLEG